MKGILTNDYLIFKRSWPVLLLLLVLIGSILVWQDGVQGLVAFCSCLFAFQMNNLIIENRSSGWDAYSISFPLSRKKLIQTEYLEAFLLTFSGYLLGVLLYSGLQAIEQTPIEPQVLELVLLIAILFPFGALSLMLPLCHLLGRAKNLFTILFSILLPGVLCCIWMMQISVETVELANGMLVAIPDLHLPLLEALSGLSVILFLLSALLVPGYLSKKDL